MKKQYYLNYQKTVIIIRRRELIENNHFFLYSDVVCILFSKMMILQKNSHEFCYRCWIDRRKKIKNSIGKLNLKSKSFLYTVWLIFMSLWYELWINFSFSCSTVCFTGYLIAIIFHDCKLLLNSQAIDSVTLLVITGSWH